MILLPDYLCESIIEVVHQFRLKIIFYSVNENLTIDEIDFSTKYLKTSIVLLINYFGGIDCASQVSVIRALDKNACIIEDNVQGFYTMFKKSDADFSFTSFRKSFSVPDGGWVKSKFTDLPVATERNSFAEYKIVGGILKHLRRFDEINDQLYLDLLKKGEEKINENYHSEISTITLNIISGLKLKLTSEKRKENANFLIEGLSKLNLKSIVKFSCSDIPLFIPIQLKNRDIVRAELFKENIFCPVHWPVLNHYDLKKGKELAQNELSLIIDQRYGIEEMSRILNVLKKIGNNENEDYR